MLLKEKSALEKLQNKSRKLPIANGSHITELQYKTYTVDNLSTVASVRLKQINEFANILSKVLKEDPSEIFKILIDKDGFIVHSKGVLSPPFLGREWSLDKWNSLLETL